MTKFSDTQTPAAAPKEGEKGQNPWDALAKGSKCLAKSTEPGEDGYYLAVVEEISADGKTLTLKWVGYPKLDTFKVRKLAVGLLAKIQ